MVRSIYKVHHQWLFEASILDIFRMIIANCDRLSLLFELLCGRDNIKLFLWIFLGTLWYHNEKFTHLEEFVLSIDELIEVLFPRVCWKMAGRKLAWLHLIFDKDNKLFMYYVMLILKNNWKMSGNYFLINKLNARSFLPFNTQNGYKEKFIQNFGGT